MARSIQRQLFDAFAARKARDGMTLDQLLLLSGLKCSADSLGRKLRGDQSLRVQEAEKLAKALNVIITAGRNVSRPVDLDDEKPVSAVSEIYEARPSKRSRGKAAA